MHVNPEAQVVHPVNPVPPHCPYCATAQAPGADGLELAPLDVVCVARVVVVAGLTGVLVAAETPGVLFSAPEQGAPADLVEPPEYTVGPGAL